MDIPVGFLWGDLT